MLRPEQCGADFHPEAEGDLNQLLNWALKNKIDTLVQIIVGTAGSGKTRLMQEVCRRLMDQEWITGFLRSSPPANSSKEFEYFWSAVTSNCLIVIDYAESRPSEVSALLRSVINRHRSSLIRIVFLARNTQGWWYEQLLKDRLVLALAESHKFSGEMIVNAFGAQRDDRQSIFLQALESYAKKLGCSIPDERLIKPPEFLEETNGEPLYIHLAAIAYLRGENPKTLQELLHFTLLRERSYWVKILKKYGLFESYWKGFFQIVAGITLLGGVQNDAKVIELIDELSSTKAFTSEEKQKIREILSYFFHRGSGVDALRPDRLGEVFLLEECAQDPHLLDTVIKQCQGRQKQLSVLAILERVSSKYVYKNADSTLALLNEHKNMLFKELRPLVCKVIEKVIQSAGYNKKHILDKVVTRIEETFRDGGIGCTVETTKLTPYDIYSQMKSNSLSFSEVLDILKISITVENESDCYNALGLVHTTYRPIPGGFKDYIAVPSAKGYRALHTAVLVSDRLPLSFSIFTKSMKHFAKECPSSWLPLQ